MPPIGPATLSEFDTQPSTSVALTLVAGDTLVSTLLNSPTCRAVFCGTAGTYYIQHVGNGGAYVPYTVPAGTWIRGKITAIGGTTRGSTAGTVNLEV